jgi:hypothetical protein
MTPEQYELVRDLFRNLILDPEYGSGTAGDSKQRRILDAFAREGLASFDWLLTQPVDGQFEAQRGHEIAKAVVEECVTSANAHPDWPESWIAEAAADFVSLRAPAARQDMEFAVHRAARTVLESMCSTFITLMILETSTDDNPRPGLEAVAQSIGLIWAQWMLWSQPWEFAAFQGRDEAP